MKSFNADRVQAHAIHHLICIYRPDALHNCCIEFPTYSRRNTSRSAHTPTAEGHLRRQQRCEGSCPGFTTKHGYTTVSNSELSGWRTTDWQSFAAQQSNATACYPWPNTLICCDAPRTTLLGSGGQGNVHRSPALRRGLPWASECPPSGVVSGWMV